MKDNQVDDNENCDCGGCDCQKTHFGDTTLADALGCAAIVLALLLGTAAIILSLKP